MGLKMKLVGCLWLYFALVSCVGSQRLNSWESSQSGYGSNSGSSSWNSNNDRNSFTSNQNSGYDSWDSNVPLDPKDSYSVWNSNNNNNRKTSSGSNTGSWDSGSFNSNRQPIKETFSNLGNDEKSNWKTASGNGKNSGSTSWSSNKLSTTNKTPKKQKPNIGNSGNLESDAFSTNNRPNEKKSASITNYPNSGNWNSNSNGFSSGGNNNENSFSSWGSSSNFGKNPKPSSSYNQNSNSGSYGSNSFDSNNGPNSNEILGYEGDSIWNDKKTTPKPNRYSKTTPKPNKNSQNSGTGGWDSNSFDSNNEPVSNEILGYEGDSVWNNKKTTPKPNRYSKTTPKPNKNSQNSGTGGWDSNNKKNYSDKKPSKNSGTSDWDSSANFNNEQNEKNTNEENEKKSSAPDLSFLDDLDKNDWYFGKESEYPSAPFKSNLNIDVSELWNFGRNQKNNGNSGGSNRRRNREAEEFGDRVQCECVSVFLCSLEDSILTKADLGNDVRPIEDFRCPRSTDVCCTNPKLGHFVRENVIQEVTGEGSLLCGQRRINGNFRDNSAQQGEFPWNLKLESLAVDMNCSASLIHSQMALTAAHCVESSQPSDLEALAGIWSTNGEPFIRRKIAKIIIHPNYSNKNPRNDIALLVFETPFELTDNVNTICLPVTNDKWDPNKCIVTDWKSDGKILSGLRKGVVGFLPQYECQNIMLVTDFWREYILHDSFVCGVEKTGREPCLGDEGSAVVCPSLKSPGTYLQIGIVSNSLNCDEYGRPGILTNVLNFLDWINGKTFDLGLFDVIDIRSLF